MSVWLIPGDSRDILANLPEDSCDACVTDPPYSLVSIQKRYGKPGSAPTQYGKDGAHGRVSAGFMGQTWDNGETSHDPFFWAQVYRVLKPGSHLVAMGGTRTYHKLASAIEDAGFEVRDMVAWMYGTGFPKRPGLLKPAFEPIVIARKEGPGALNTEACRIGTESTIRFNHAGTAGPGWRFGNKDHVNGSAHGRWPANVVTDGDCRYFYSAKAGPEDRLGSKHPTIKPVSLIRWLMRLVMPPSGGGTVLDPFAGSGTSATAALAEGFDAILIEREEAYIADIEARLAYHRGEGGVRHRAARSPPRERVEAGLFAGAGHEDRAV